MLQQTELRNNVFYFYLNCSIDWFIWRNILTHAHTHIEHIALYSNDAYAITNSTTMWKKYKEGSYDNFRGNSLHPHMTCIWISIKKRTHHPYVYDRISTHTLSKIVLLFYAHRFPFSAIDLPVLSSPLLPKLFWCFRTCRMISNKIFGFSVQISVCMQYVFYDTKQQKYDR